MRDWPGINPATEPDPIRRDKDAKIDFFLRDLTRGMGRIQRGELPDDEDITAADRLIVESPTPTGSPIMAH